MKDMNEQQELANAIDEHFAQLREVAQEFADASTERTADERAAMVGQADMEEALRTIFTAPTKGHVGTVEVYEAKQVKGDGALGYTMAWHATVDDLIAHAVEKAAECARADHGERHLAFSVCAHGDKFNEKRDPSIPDRYIWRKRTAAADNIVQAFACIAECDGTPLASYRKMLEADLIPTVATEPAHTLPPMSWR